MITTTTTTDDCCLYNTVLYLFKKKKLFFWRAKYKRGKKYSCVAKKNSSFDRYACLLFNCV